MEEKEDQCKTFRELLLEKENEIEELSQRVVGGEDAGDQMVAMKQKLTSVLTSRGEILVIQIDKVDLIQGHHFLSCGLFPLQDKV